MSGRQARKRRRDEERERSDALEISGVMRVLTKMDETLPPSKDQFTPVQRLSHIKEANLWSLEDLEQALRKMNANVQSGHQKGSLQQEKAAKLLAVGLSLINQCRLRREAGESMPESPVADGGGDGEAIPPTKNQFLVLINTDGSVQYTTTSRKPLTSTEIKELPPHVRVGVVHPTPPGFIATTEKDGVLKFGTELELFDLPAPPFKPRGVASPTFLDYGEFSSFAPSIGSDGDPLVRSVKAPKRSKKSGIPTVDMAEARALAEDPHAEPAAVLEMNAALFKKLESLQEARLLKSAFAPSEDEIETSKLIERNLAKLAARTAPAQVLDKKAVEKAALMIPLYQARDALFQGTLRGLQ